MPELLNVTDDIIKAKEKERRVYPCHVNRASEIGHPCMRYLVYSRLDWDKRLMTSVEIQFIFDGGNVVEELVKRDLEKAGYQIIEHNRSYEWDKYQISGHIDFMLQDRNDFIFPVEAKWLQDSEMNRLTCLEDFLSSRKPWVKKYPAQLTAYLLLTNKEYGMFLIKGKPSMQIKHIWIELDYGYAESVVKKCIAINKHVKEKTYPDRIEFDHKICGYCPFAHICLQDIINKESDISDNIDLVNKLDRYFEIQETAKEHDDLKEEIKQLTERQDSVIAGGKYKVWYLTYDKKTYDIPKEIKNQYQSTIPIRSIRIEKL